jgi:hypothetical protein
MSEHMLVKSATLILLASIGISAAEHQRDWQTGKLLDTDRNRYFAGTFTPAGPNGHGQFGYPLYRAIQDYVIDAGTYIYVAEERVRPKSKPVNLVINAPVKYAIEKRKLYVIDDDGKEHEAQIVKQILKQ